MSKIVAVLATTVGFGSKVKRTIDHSPDFPGPEADSRDGRPLTRVPPGGLITG